MTFPVLVRHDQMQETLVKPRTRRKPKISVALPRISINTSKPIKVERVNIVDSAGIVVTKLFTAVLVGGLFGISLMVVPVISSLVASLAFFGGIAVNEFLVSGLLNAVAFAAALFLYGVVTDELHKRA